MALKEEEKRGTNGALGTPFRNPHASSTESGFPTSSPSTGFPDATFRSPRTGDTEGQDAEEPECKSAVAL